MEEPNAQHALAMHSATVEVGIEALQGTAKGAPWKLSVFLGAKLQEQRKHSTRLPCNADECKKDVKLIAGLGWGP